LSKWDWDADMVRRPIEGAGVRKIEESVSLGIPYLNIALVRDSWKFLISSVYYMPGYCIIQI